MSWQIFKNDVLNAMSSNPPDVETVAEAIANAYNKAMTSPTSGDLIFRNTVSKGDTDGMKSWLILVLNQQSVSLVQLPIINMFVTGFIKYWTGATLSKTNTPPLPPPGATKTIVITNNVTVNPGAPIPAPYDMSGLNEIEPFIDKLIDAGTKHLTSISGLAYTSCLTGAPPAQTILDIPIPWQGYSVEPAELGPLYEDIVLEQNDRVTLEEEPDDSVTETFPVAKEYHQGQENKNDEQAKKDYKIDIQDSKGKEFQKEDIDVYYGEDVGFAAQKTNWACLVTSLANLLKKYKIKGKDGKDVVTEATFIKFYKGQYQYSGDNVAQGKYMNGNNFNSGAFFEDAPKLLGGSFTRIRKTLKGEKSQQQVYDSYKSTLRTIKRPMIIRVAGTSRRARGHFVIMLGITKKGEIIVRDCGSQASVRSDKTYTVARMMGGSEPDSGNNFDVMYFTKK
jgi:hypothetical protein